MKQGGKIIANEQWLTPINFCAFCVYTADASEVTEGEAATPPLLRKSPNDAASLHQSEKRTDGLALHNTHAQTLFSAFSLP